MGSTQRRCVKVRLTDHPQARVAVRGTFGFHDNENARATRTAQYTGHQPQPMGNRSWNFSLHTDPEFPEKSASDYAPAESHGVGSSGERGGGDVSS